MRNRAVQSVTTVTLLMFGGMGTVKAQQQAAPAPSQFKLSTSAYTEGSQIPSQFTCADTNAASPPLQWSNPPKNTVTFAVVFHDTDGAPAKSSTDVTHWILWNIPASSAQLAGGNKSRRFTGRHCAGQKYPGNERLSGALPPPGATPHHYIFEIYALDSKLDLPAGSGRADLLKATDGHVIGKATYVGLFGR